MHFTHFQSFLSYKNTSIFKTKSISKTNQTYISCANDDYMFRTKSKSQRRPINQPTDKIHILSSFIGKYLNLDPMPIM